MKLSEIKEILEANVLVGEENLDIQAVSFLHGSRETAKCVDNGSPYQTFLIFE